MTGRIRHLAARRVRPPADIVRGASLVVWAVREGQDAAKDIHHYLKVQLLAQAAE
ncbi:MAG: hypothetical protein WDN06_16645 [Asticcacaulis sp.]